MTGYGAVLRLNLFFGQYDSDMILYGSDKIKLEILNLTPREKRPNTEFFLVRIFLYSEQK